MPNQQSWHKHIPYNRLNTISNRVETIKYIRSTTKTRRWTMVQRVEEMKYPQFITIIETFKQYYERTLNFFNQRLTRYKCGIIQCKAKEFQVYTITCIRILLNPQDYIPTMPLSFISCKDTHLPEEYNMKFQDYGLTR